VGERRRSASIAVRPELQDRYNAELQERSRSAVWLTGCRSWLSRRFGQQPRAVARSDRRLLAAQKHLRQDEYWFGEVRDHIARTDHNSY